MPHGCGRVGELVARVRVPYMSIIIIRVEGAVLGCGRLIKAQEIETKACQLMQVILVVFKCSLAVFWVNCKQA